jgi:hypothetical protein
VRDIGIATHREPVVVREPRGSFRLEFCGLSGARSSVDRDMRIVLPATLAARLWQLLGDNLTDRRRPMVHRDPIVAALDRAEGPWRGWLKAIRSYADYGCPRRSARLECGRQRACRPSRCALTTAIAHCPFVIW